MCGVVLPLPLYVSMVGIGMHFKISHFFYLGVTVVNMKCAVVLCCSVRILRNVGQAGLWLSDCAVVYLVPCV
jgi:hypothetical protein